VFRRLNEKQIIWAVQTQNNINKEKKHLMIPFFFIADYTVHSLQLVQNLSKNSLITVIHGDSDYLIATRPLELLYKKTWKNVIAVTMINKINHCHNY
jgi:hypothetical protein